MKNQESVENYLERILMLSLDGKKARSVDIALEMNFTRASVSVAMKKLRASGYINIEPGGFIILTEKGKKIAEIIYERHIILRDWLVSLGVEPKTALNDACAIEHVISEQSFEAMRDYINK